MPFKTTHWDDVEGAAARDECSWNRIYESYYAPLFFIVRKRSGFDDALCEEIAHDVLTEMYVQGAIVRAVEFKREHPEARFGDYLFKRMLYAIHNKLREKKARQTADPKEEAVTGEDDVADFERLWAVQNVFIPAIRKLRHECRKQGKDGEYRTFLDRYLFGNKPGSLAEGGGNAKRISRDAIVMKDRFKAIIEERLKREAGRAEAAYDLLREEFFRIFSVLGAEEFEKMTTESYEMLLSKEHERITTTR